MECCRRMSSGAALNFAVAELGRSRNPSVDRLLAFVGVFEADWRTELDEFLTQERRIAIGSVVGLRTAISHGEPAIITYARIEDYSAAVFAVVEFLAERFDPQR